MAEGSHLMARLVVRNRDKVNPDSPYLDAMCMKRGMVVDILPDGMGLGAVGDKYDGWTVVEVPGVAVEDLSAYRAPEAGDPKINRMLQRRAFKFDLDAYELSGKAALTSLEAQALKTPVASRVDPAVL